MKRYVRDDGVRIARVPLSKRAQATKAQILAMFVEEIPTGDPDRLVVRSVLTKEITEWKRSQGSEYFEEYPWG